MLVRLVLSFALTVSFHFANAQSIFELNGNLGKGINMGNMFEAPSETEWGNPFQDGYFTKIADLGFNHVRIPIRWDIPERTMPTSPYTIDDTFLTRIKSVVDQALAEDLYVIINMHHHDEIFDHPDEVKSRFLSQWEQIAELFKDYDDQLLFEVLNEPNTNLTPAKWNIFFADALEVIRITNPTRAVLMGTANWGGLGGVSELLIPDDDRLILTIHYYEPFNFTHQGASWVGENANAWLGTKWENTNLERQEVELGFQFLKIFARDNNIPVHIGEFGAFSTADLDSRVKWTTFLARWFEEQGFSWAYWEFSAGFGIYNPSTGQYLQPLADALLSNPMSEPNIVKTEVVFESKFTMDDTEWILNVNPAASASWTKSDGTASITIDQSSDNGWHIQLLKPGIALKEGSQYLVSFEASADDLTSFSTYIGKSGGDYSAYSGYKSYSANKDFFKFAYTFSMQSPDDPNARVAFDLGTAQTTFYLKNFVIEEILPETVSTIAIDDPNLKVFPNPAQDVLILKGIKEYKRFNLYNSIGISVLSGVLNQENEKVVSLKGLNGYVLYLVLKNEEKVVTRKILRIE